MFDLNPSLPFRSEEEYRAALSEIRPYFEDEPDEGSDEAARFDMLFMRIEKHEAELQSILTSNTTGTI
jgi:HTH-type transcriptional regulator/antitoxin HigA